MPLAPLEPPPQPLINLDKETVDNMAASLQFTVFTTFVINLALANSLGELFGSVNQIIFAVDTPVVKCKFPGSVLSVSGFLVKIFAFDII